MKRNYKALLLVGVFAIALWSFMPSKPSFSEKDNDQDKLLLELVTFVLQRGHYSPVDINDDFSKDVYESYLKALDPNKRFFLKSDIEEFDKYKLLLDDQIKNKDLTFFNLTYDRLMTRMNESKSFYKDILSKPFNFSEVEEFDADYDKMEFLNTVPELKDRWRKQLKLWVLSSIVNKEKLQEGKESTDDLEQEDTNTINLTKKEKTPAEKKSFEKLEEESRESNLKQLNEYFEFVEGFKKQDWFSIYVNSIAEQFDPHTNYFAPEDKEKFDVSMRGKFEGIGARLQKKNDVIEISELISGGPAWRDQQLEAGDLIMKVGQKGEEPIDISGMRLDDVVKKIKGPKGTQVILTVKKVDGSIKEIAVTRDVVELEETYARSSTVVKDGKKFGVIYLPKFYINFDNKDDRDAAKDVEAELKYLKEQNVEGIIMDLRDNGGGSLKTVVDIVGLFIEKGPVVQVKSPGNNKDVLSDRDSKIHYSGPLVVLVNSFSASASEIFAAAIQDYKRGIVIGSKQTFGKGTVQNLIDLNQFMRNSNADYGSLKTTTQKYYRINGGSTQLMGVESDIVLPDRYAYIDKGERDMKKAMPWDKIDAANYETWIETDKFNSIISKSKDRIKKSEQFALIDKNAMWIKSQRDKSVFNLNYNKFKSDIEAEDSKREEFKVLNKFKTDLKFTSLPYEVEMMKKDTILAEKRKRWHENLAKDVYIDESLNVLLDLSSVSKSSKTKAKKK